jgi:hypothetical protein
MYKSMCTCHTSFCVCNVSSHETFCCQCRSFPIQMTKQWGDEACLIFQAQKQNTPMLFLFF